ncbi:Signal recognition particle receptor alpha subunit [Operophtera brumata]|uniref:Signal recognition particle receptor alpha subunit n=1 Tax=Operophtera brumata TaxID=104452 RepID=A0A0L7L209_OPEBR|nr:Signal recognition particle receptor alpha subunit [Operophtera brumata]
MLDLFSIFSKGGIVLWCFQSTGEIFSPSVNALIRSVILQERTGNNTHNHNALTLQYKLDNEFELVFVVAYQRILQLSYIDKFLNDVHLEFRDKYKNELTGGSQLMDFDFMKSFNRILRDAEEWGKLQAKIPKRMKTFEDSLKSKKTVASMIERKGEEKGKKSVVVEKERVKQPRIWEMGGNSRDLPTLDFSTDKDGDHQPEINPDTQLVGQMTGAIRDLEVESEESSSEEEYEEERQATPKKSSGMFSIFKERGVRHRQQAVLGTFDSVAKTVKGTLTESLVSILSPKRRVDILRDCLHAKSQGRPYVTAFCGKRRVDILRDCLHAKSQGRPYVTAFCGICFWLIENELSVLIAACDTFRAGAVEQLRTHVRHLNALHPAASHRGRTMVHLYEKGYVRQLRTHVRHLNALHPAASHRGCTMVHLYEKGYVRQLRTHVRHLNALHPAASHRGCTMVHLYEKGYGKDAAGIAMEAIRYANDSKIDVVLIDTAGRMQDNEPLMRALAKLIKALVGNEAVDQLVKFNQALADHSASNNPHVIDGIVLTKFDTIDDKRLYNEAVDQLVKFNQALADHSASNNPHVIDGIVLTKFDTIDDKRLYNEAVDQLVKFNQALADHSASNNPHVIDGIVLTKSDTIDDKRLYNEAVDQLVKFNQALADHSASNNPHVIDGIVLTKFDTIDDKN